MNPEILSPAITKGRHQVDTGGQATTHCATHRRDRGAASCLPRQHRSAAHINKIMNCFHLEGHGNAPRTAYPGPAVPCTTPPRGGTTKKKADHPEPAINGHRDLPRQHPSALHLPRLPEPPTHDLTYTRNARASTSPRSIGFCVIWDCISSSSSSSSSIILLTSRVSIYLYFDNATVATPRN